MNSTSTPSPSPDSETADRATADRAAPAIRTEANRVGERGQATAEYALVIVAAAAIALALIVWASTSGALSGLFDSVVAKVASHV